MPNERVESEFSTGRGEAAHRFLKSHGPRRLMQRYVYGVTHAVV